MLYLDGLLLVDNGNLFASAERCITTTLHAGKSTIYMEGFSTPDAVGVQAKYSGPDTNSLKVDLSPCYSADVGSTSSPLRWLCLSGGINHRQYGNNEHMEAIIAPPGNGSTALGLSYFNTQPGLDTLTVYHCDSPDSCTDNTSTLLYTASGQAVPPVVNVSRGAMLLEWRSDGSVNSTGWSATWNSHLFYSLCDPTVDGAIDPPSLFVVCVFQSTEPLAAVPSIGHAGANNSPLHYVSTGKLQVVALNGSDSFREAVGDTPETNFAWAVYGQVLISQPGNYSFCITSNSGVKLLLDGLILLDQDGLKSTVELCAVTSLISGTHILYLEGFQGSHSALLQARYSGPDTNFQKLFITQCNTAFLSGTSLTWACSSGIISHRVSSGERQDLQAVIAPPDASVTLSFAYFDTWREHDYLSVYQCNNETSCSEENKTLLYRWSGQGTPTSVSSKAAMLLVWHSDASSNSSAQYRGWRAQWSSVEYYPQCNPYADDAFGSPSSPDAFHLCTFGVPANFWDVAYMPRLPPIAQALDQILKYLGKGSMPEVNLRKMAQAQD